MIRDIVRPARKLLFAVVLLAPSLAFCQQSTDTSATQDPGAANPPAQTQDSGTPSQSGPIQGPPASAAGSQGLFARTLDSASPLSADNGPLHWGWLSVRSISFQELFNNVTLNNSTQTVSQDFNASELSAAIVLSHAVGASRRTLLTVQYVPSLSIFDGHVYSNTLNQSAGVDTTFQLSPRWGLQLSDRFKYFGNQRYFTGLSLGVDFSQGTVVQNSFLNGPGRVIYNSVSGTFTYLWSPRTSISFAPTFGYEDSKGATNSGQNLTAFYGGGEVKVSHALTSSQSVGFTYIGQYGAYTNTSTTAGPQSNSLLQDVLVTYGKQIGESWHLGLGLGLTETGDGRSNQSGLGVNAGVSKSFHRTDFAVSYNRGHQFNGYITSLSSDRVDFVNTIRWTPRFSNSSSIAYFRTAEGPGAAQSGSYGTEQLSFLLTGALSVTGGIAYTRQTGDGVFIPNGHLRSATIGVTWAPAARPQY
jgi:hypothetical protein